MSEKPASRRPSARVLTALVAIPLVALAVWWNDGALVLPVVLVLAVLAMQELTVAAGQAGTPLVGEIAYPAVVALLVVPELSSRLRPRSGLTVTPWSPGLPAWLWLLPCALLAWAVLRYASPRRVTLASVALTLLSVLYVALFAFLPLLRDWALGLTLLWLVLLGVWTGDTVAYYAGRAWGRRKLTTLSPGKTHEGLLAGMAATVLACCLVARVGGIAAGHGLAMGALVAVAAPLGDLVESFWKRELGVKDLGRLLPGHGGVLDRCDSLLFAAFVTYLYAQWQLAAPCGAASWCR